MMALKTKIQLRKSQPSDLPFLREMLFEAVFWRNNPNKPSFEEGISFPDVSKSLDDWGKREGDTGVIATIDSVLVGAAWYRYWTDLNSIRGYIDDSIPVIVIGVHSEYRHQGIGTKMIEWLVEYATKISVEEISLMVSKDNYAINLYRKTGFVEFADKNDSFIMLRKIRNP